MIFMNRKDTSLLWDLLFHNRSLYLALSPNNFSRHFTSCHHDPRTDTINTYYFEWTVLGGKVNQMFFFVNVKRKEVKFEKKNHLDGCHLCSDRWIGLKVIQSVKVANTTEKHISILSPPEGTLLFWSASHRPTRWTDPSSFPCCNIQIIIILTKVFPSLPVEIIVELCSFHSTDSFAHKLICLEGKCLGPSFQMLLTLFICFLRPGRNAILAAYTQLWNKSWYFSWNVKEQESGTNFCLHHPFVFCLSVLPVATLCTDKRYKDLLQSKFYKNEKATTVFKQYHNPQVFTIELWRARLT